MAITLTIAGVDRTTALRRLSWSVEKRLANETFRAELLGTTFSSSAYAPTVGQELTLYHGADLLFGGRITDVRRARLDDEGPIVTAIDARGWEALAEEVIVTATIASTTALAMGYALFLAHLQPRGCTWVGATSGGPTVPALAVDHQPLAQVYQQIGKLGGYLFRINGAKQAGMVAAGDLVAPESWTASDVLKGFVFSKSRVDRATRAYVRTGGTGEVTHSEGRTGNGVKTTFPLNVEPLTAPTEVDENGTVYALPSATWTYDAATRAVVRASALGNGVPITVAYPVAFPAWVRCWQSSIEQSSGALNDATAVDVVLQMTEVTDLAQAKALGDAELTRRVSEPWVAQGRTRTPGWYPLLQLPVSMSAQHGVNADFLVTAVTVTPDDLDEETTTEHVTYAVEAIEGDTPGRQWEQLFFELLGSGSGGGIAITGTTTIGGGTPPSAIPAPFIGYGVPLGGANVQTLALTTSWQDVGEANPMPHPADPSGTWTLRVYAYQLAAGTMEVRLMVGGVEVALVSTTATGSYVDVSFFGSALTDTYTGPAAVGQCLLQARVTSGTRSGVVGQCHTVKTA